ncbi:hypothetical protein [Flavobacterium anhuiense]|uniref:hypothetical protein n=1 Tax=Flavobacterium anhuiense TaxID=459526 RepID=UPI0020266673|nr:hypothetical protein [Flavobacterium anhuiense]URM37159.1 hypothetical protein LLY39_00780 [Flavobacterium anhuiense]
MQKVGLFVKIFVKLTQKQNPMSINWAYFGNILLKIWETIKNYFYLILLILSIVYFLYYLSEIWNAPSNFEASQKYKVLSILKDIAVIVFSAGIFTSSLKFLAFIKIFETEFEKLFKSKNYGGQIESAIQSITLSKEYFANQARIKDIWKDVTLCMYQKQFPELHDKISEALDNDYYNNLEYYYKDEKVEFKITSVDDNYIKIEQSVVYFLKRPDASPFNWKFGFSHLNNNDHPREIEIEFLNSDTKYNPELHLKEEEINGGKDIMKTINVPLSGQQEYRIKRRLVEIQNFKADRFWSFKNAKIVDNLNISIDFGKDLNVLFVESNSKQKFTTLRDFPNSKTFISNQIILPGEQFKLFFLKV